MDIHRMDMKHQPLFSLASSTRLGSLALQWTGGSLPTGFPMGQHCALKHENEIITLRMRKKKDWLDEQDKVRCGKVHHRVLKI